MILLISNIAIETAPALEDLFPAGAVTLITASDFHQSCRAAIRVNDFLTSSLAFNNITISPESITGVITAIPFFLPLEFYFIKPEDQNYVCEEMNAFFLYFLSQLTCKKLNPSGRRMFTVSVSKMEMIKTALKLQIPVHELHLKNNIPVLVEPKSEQMLLKCTLIGGRIIDKGCPEEVHQYVKKLANAFSVSYLDCYFVSDEKKKNMLVDVNTIPDISNPENRQAIADYFLNAE